MTTEKKKIPILAFRQIAGNEIQAKKEDSGNLTFNVQALGGEVIEHWWFGRIVQDMAGMTMAAERIPLDYNHDAGEVIGFAEIQSTIEGLFLTATIVPFENDRGAEIAHKIAAGVPYQSSIDYVPTKPDEILYEYIAENEITQVNGKEFEGPLTVVRKWTLHGLAICPHGADSDTSVKAQQSKNEDNTMEVSVMEKTNEKEVQAQEEVLPIVDSRAEFRQFVAEFGAEKASEYFQKGLTFEQAEKQSASDTKAELEALKQSKDAADKELAELKAANDAHKQSQEVDAHFDGETETATFTRQSIRAMSREEYQQNRDAILAAANKGEVK